MNEEIKTKWIEALRSGSYNQGQRQLKTNDHRFCCLGVLCDVVAPSGWNVFNEHQGMVGAPSAAFIKDVGIPDRLPDGHSPIQQLVMMNDGLNRSFSDIADWIEETL